MALSEQILFGILAAMVLGSAIMVVTLRNIVHCALFLVFSFLGIAGLYVLLNAEFLFAAQILVYVGAISVLIIFGIMLTHELTGRGVRVYNGQVLPALMVAGVLLVAVIRPAIFTAWGRSPLPGPATPNTIDVVGSQLLTTYLLPFELASLLLLVAMVGAIVMAMLTDRPEPVVLEASTPESKPAEQGEPEAAPEGATEPKAHVEETVS